MKLLILISILLSWAANSAVPTPESLFRNGNNKSLSGNFVVLKFTIQEDLKDGEVVAPQPDSNSGEPTTANSNKVKFIKFIYSLESENKIQLLQAIYNNGDMKNSSLIKADYIEDINLQIANDTIIERALFNSLQMMFSLNESSGVVNVLKSHNQKFIANENLLNVDKKNLLEKYKEYLLAIKEDKTKEEELKSPLKPEEAEEKEKVSEIMKGSMYAKGDDVSLIRKNRKFYWKVAYENFFALFNHESHRLTDIELMAPNGNVSGRFGDYILFDGIHELPKVSIIKKIDGRKFKIRMLSLREFVNKGKNLKTRAREYQKNLSKNRIEAFEQASDSFFY